MKNLYFIFLLIGLTPTIQSSQPALSDLQSAQGTDQVDKQISTQSVLIFLDDSEISRPRIGAISINFMAAFTQEASPIIVSASVIANMRPQYEDKTKTLAQLYEEFKWRLNLPSDEKLDDLKFKQMALTFLNFFQEAQKKWIVKEISPLLYLLLPKKYLEDKKIALTDSDIERKLGLKINNMKTIDANMIKGPEAPPQFRDYFVDSLSSIFVSSSEYPISDKKLIPQWVVFINGHGLTNYSVCGLSIEKFKDFLTFLTKIKMKFLVYSSCYAAGVNSAEIYKEKDVYNFPIIAMALTDAPTYSAGMSVPSILGYTIQVKFALDFHCFIEKAMKQSLFPEDFNSAISCIARKLTSSSLLKETLIGDVAQIKYPGLPWFPIDRSAVVAIGDVMAKSRTKPLDVATFFAQKKGARATPLGILLYSKNIPFEIIINDKNKLTGKAPQFVSMVPTPDDLLLRAHDSVIIKKISSKNISVEELLYSFFIPDLAFQKTFFINELTAVFQKRGGYSILGGYSRPETFKDVFIEVTRDTITVYCMGDGGILYYAYGEYRGQKINIKNKFAPATDMQELGYKGLFGYYGIEQAFLSDDHKKVRNVQESKIAGKDISAAVKSQETLSPEYVPESVKVLEKVSEKPSGSLKKIYKRSEVLKKYIKDKAIKS